MPLIVKFARFFQQIQDGFAKMSDSGGNTFSGPKTPVFGSKKDICSDILVKKAHFRSFLANFVTLLQNHPVKSDPVMKPDRP